MSRRLFQRVSQKKFTSMLKMATDDSERRLLQNSFHEGRNGFLALIPPQDEKAAKKLTIILKRIRKARRGPRIFRIGLLLLVVGSPIVFGLVFLDGLAARYLEAALEGLSETDVTIEGLDIAVFRGSVEVTRLAFASIDDPMVDAWVISGAVADLDSSSLAHRRLVFDSLKGGLSRDEQRTSPASYPKESERAGAGPSGFDASSLADFDWIPREDLPTESWELAKELRAAAEADYERWQDAAAAEVGDAEELAGRVADFVDQPLPDAKNVSAWIARLEEARSLAAELSSTGRRLSSIRTELQGQVNDLRSAKSEAQKAMEEDLSRIEAAMKPDREMMNRWLESAIRGYLGKSASSWYNRILRLASRAENLAKDDGRASRPGRMKTGRIVDFPVNLPPRFSIRDLNLSGEGFSVVGRNVCIDHQLSGNPSELAIRSPAMEANIVVDGRSDADVVVEANYRLTSMEWGKLDDPRSLGGLIDLSGDLVVEDRSAENATSSGSVVLRDWSGTLDIGGVMVIKEQRPPLGLTFVVNMRSGTPSFSINMDESSLGVWTDSLASEILPTGMADARKAVMAGIQGDLSGLDELLADWAGASAELDGVQSLLSGRSEELSDLILQLNDQSPASVPPLNAEGAVEGLRSLF